LLKPLAGGASSSTCMRQWIASRPHGEILCDRVHNAICETCRVLMSRGITGPFETWREGVPYACMGGDIATTAGLTVKEPDNGVVAFARWNAFPLSPVQPRTHEDDGTGRREPADANPSLRSDRRTMLVAAE
jgi:hypothetical protein